MKYTNMIKELLKVNQLDWDIPSDERKQERLFNKLRTISKPTDLSEEYYENEREYLQSKASMQEIKQVDDIDEKLIDNIYIYLGDITKIKADAIVNAANEKLLGCFIPGHKCIDNAIHMASGLHLRNACNEVMQAQGHDEPAGTAKLTNGYELPSKYVFHTVGPNIYKLKYLGDDNKIAEAVYEQLAGCYNTILDMAGNKDDINNVVFCSISTGVYGVPITFASRIAINTIREYMRENPDKLDKVIINVFSKEDYNEYKKQAEQI